jgi:hypothetical protein
MQSNQQKAAASPFGAQPAQQSPFTLDPAPTNFVEGCCFAMFVGWANGFLATFEAEACIDVKQLPGTLWQSQSALLKNGQYNYGANQLCSW